MRRYGIAELFDATQGLGDNLAAGKVTAGRELVQRCRIEPDRTVIIGDTTHDAAVAKELGMECLLLAFRPPFSGTPLVAGPAGI